MLQAKNFNQIVTNLRALGPGRLAALGIMAALTITAVIVAARYMSQPAYETLYVGLNAQDVTRISAALNEAGIAYDVNAEGTGVMVRRGEAVRARMLLADKGLPGSPGAGYELFDKLGSMGLTSFMQDITRVRALEGEIARTIQGMKGVKAARVHIVMPDAGSFRRSRQTPSASVVVRPETPGEFPSAQAMRHLVAAAVPAMTAEQVTVLSTDGAVLGSAAEELGAASAKMLGMEKTVARALEDNVRRTLVPFLGAGNFEISVTARLNTDKRQISETAFDPESRVERSVRSVKETSSSQNNGKNWPASVESNLPAEQTASRQGDQSSKQNDRREELTNFELNSKSVSTVSDGYRIENLAVAVVFNRKRFADAVGGKEVSAEIIDAQVKEVERLASSAAGIDAKRGDRVTVAAVDFLGDGSLEPVPGPGIGSELLAHLGVAINAAALLGATFILVWFGLRPAVTMILERAAPAPQMAITADSGARALGAPPAMDPLAAAVTPLQPINLGANALQKRLEQVIEGNDEKVAEVLKQWMRS